MKKEISTLRVNCLPNIKALLRYVKLNSFYGTAMSVEPQTSYLSKDEMTFLAQICGKKLANTIKSKLTPLHRDQVDIYSVS